MIIWYYSDILWYSMIDHVSALKCPFIEVPIQFRDFPSITTPAAPAPPAGATHWVAAAHGTLKAIGCLLWWPLGRALRFGLVMAFFDMCWMDFCWMGGCFMQKSWNATKQNEDMIWYDMIWYDMIWTSNNGWRYWYSPTKRWGYNTNKLVGIYTANSI